MSTAWRERLGAFGIWTNARQWPTDLGAVRDAAAELEALGFGSVWIGISELPFELHEALLSATSQLVVATGITNVWTNPARDVAQRYAELADRYRGRFLLGLGASHARLVERAGIEYTKPYSKVVDYLDEVAAEPTAIPAENVLLAALRPKMLRLAAARTSGAHPYLMPPEHTADARAVLGPEPLLVPEQKVYLGTDPGEAREVARQALAVYVGLPNYTGILQQYGLEPDDFAGTGSDRWVDRTVGWGDAGTVRGRLQGHLDAGADHVAVNVLTARAAAELPLPEWRLVSEVPALARH